MAKGEAEARVPFSTGESAGQRTMRQAFGAVYLCENGHRTNLYFFDSEPERILCPRCDDGTLAELTRTLDVKGKSGRGRKKPVELSVKEPKCAA